MPFGGWDLNDTGHVWTPGDSEFTKLQVLTCGGVQKSLDLDELGFGYQTCSQNRMQNQIEDQSKTNRRSIEDQSKVISMLESNLKTLQLHQNMPKTTSTINLRPMYD